MATDLLSAQRDYVQPGHPEFLSPHRSLQEHMRAAFELAQQPPLPNPNVTGLLPQASLNALWTIISFVGQQWQISSYSRLSQQLFNSYTNLKTNQTPSYFTVYNMTVSLYQNLVLRYGQQGALIYLYTPNPSQPPPNWDVIRAWSIQEFAKLYVSQGAFYAYGWMLLPGWTGGPFNDPSNLPYRPMQNAAD
jgi:hypothetical protein